ncbi:GTP cyclohydrolase MptA [Methanocaldococcus infernus]
MRCDIQSMEPNIKIPLSRVGITNLKKLVRIKRKKKRPIILMANFSVFVNLPSNQKGIHMSRHPEVIDEIITEALEEESYSIENLCVEIVKKLLHKHEYSTEAYVEMEADYMVEELSPVSKKRSQEVHKIIGGAKGVRENNKIKIRKIIGAEVTGLTVCPCAQNLVKEECLNKLRETFSEEELKIIENSVIFASHNQRGVGKVILEVDEDVDVEVTKIIDIIKKSMSSEIFSLLKREDEKFVVISSHKNPKFVEDCVREMAKRILELNLPDNSLVQITQINEESIHRHNAFAQKISTIEELSRELNNEVKR